EGEYLIPIGKAKVVEEGDAVTIVSFGKIMKVALEASKALREDGIKAEVIDLRTIRPIDYHTVIESVKKTNRLVILEEAWPLGNISTELSYMVQRNAFDYLDAPIRRINTKDTPLPYAPTLVEAWLPNTKELINAVNDVMYINA